MARLTIADFKRQFREVVGRGDQLVVVYSGIWTFGHRFGMPAQQVAVSLVEAMLEEMGSDQTLAIPAYTYDFTRTRRYSPAKSIPETGVIPITVHRHFAHLRSKSALNSFLCIGPQAEKLVGIGGATLWGEGSIKAYFEAARARMVVLGLPWKDACGYLHRIEESCGVPYRYHKTFDGIWESSGTTSAWSETMFVRPLQVLPIFQWQLVDDLLRRRGRIRAGGGEIFIESADAAELVEAGREILADDKLALIVNRAEIQHWIDIGKRDELSALRASEPRALAYFDQFANENPLLLT
jgi:aminoglycoside N3'-acetyltransferase